MSWGVALRNALAIGLGGIVSLVSGSNELTRLFDFLAAEDGSLLVQENGSHILV